MTAIRERVLVVPVDVALVFDRDGWHAEAIPHDVDLEAICEAQDAEDAAWWERRRPACVRPAERLRAPVKRCQVGRRRRTRR